MKAIGQNSYGNADIFEDIKTDIPKVGDLDLLVKMKASAVNPVDIKVRSNFGNGGEIKSKPLIIGYDGAGVVEKIGDKVKNFKVGDEVYFSGYLGRSGTNAEFCAVDSRIVGFKPKKMSFVEASSVPLCALTAYESIFEQLVVSEDAKKK